MRHHHCHRDDGPLIAAAAPLPPAAAAARDCRLPQLRQRACQQRVNEPRQCTTAVAQVGGDHSIAGGLSDHEVLGAVAGRLEMDGLAAAGFESKVAAALASGLWSKDPDFMVHRLSQRSLLFLHKCWDLFRLSASTQT